MTEIEEAIAILVETLFIFERTGINLGLLDHKVVANRSLVPYGQLYKRLV